MNLKNTELLMKAMEQNKDFDSYGVLVSINGNKKFIHSDNVNYETYFDIASIGKALVTTQLILKALSEKKLSLENTLNDFFKNVPDDKKNITITQLLTHTSGIIRVPIPEEIADKGNDAIAEYIINAPLAYKPDCGQIYSCNAYILLGFIAEKIYKLPLDKAFYTYVKEPLHLTHCRFNIAVDEDNAAVCYKREKAGKYRADDENVYVMKGIAGNGASFWTMSDLDKFADAIMNRSEAIYSERIYDLAERDYVGQAGNARGLGYLIVDENYPQTGKLFPANSFGHCGHTGASFFISREKNMYVIILTNATRFLNMRSGFKGYDYSVIEKMREKIHNEIYKDLIEENLI